MSFGITGCFTVTQSGSGLSCPQKTIIVICLQVTTDCSGGKSCICKFTATCNSDKSAFVVLPPLENNSKLVYFTLFYFLASLGRSMGQESIPHSDDAIKLQ